jgi:hypothetical protein
MGPAGYGEGNVDNDKIEQEIAMAETVTLSPDSRTTAGVLMLTIVAIEWGGLFMLRVVRGRQGATAFQKAFFRAGHAHAGVLVILSLVGLLFIDAARLNAAFGTVARNAIPAAAILMPAGFFLSAAGRAVERPNRLVLLLYIGAASLAVGVVALGVGLLIG